MVDELLMTRTQIPWAEPRYWGQEESYAVEALRSSWISGGPFVERLEDDLQAYLGTPFAVATSNGTTALHAAFLALNVQPGDEIIVPGFAFMAAANVAINMAAVPTFADVDRDTWCITAASIAEQITPRTKGVVVVHSYGNVCDMQPILELADARGLWVIEDAAEAFGSTYRGMQAGTIAEVGTFSFHATKTITTGEGGATVTRNEDLRDRMRLFRSHGVKSRRYWHDVAGHNFRLSNIQAAIGCGQLEQIETISTERRRLYRDYERALSHVEGVKLQAIGADVDPIIWAIGLRLEPGCFSQGRDAVMSALSSHGIETRPGFAAAPEMPHIYKAGALPNSTDLGLNVISLPSSPTVTTAEIEMICSRLSELATPGR